MSSNRLSLIPNSFSDMCPNSLLDFFSSIFCHLVFFLIHMLYNPTILFVLYSLLWCEKSLFDVLFALAYYTFPCFQLQLLIVCMNPIFLQMIRLYVIQTCWGYCMFCVVCSMLRSKEHRRSNPTADISTPSSTTTFMFFFRSLSFSVCVCVFRSLF